MGGRVATVQAGAGSGEGGDGVGRRLSRVLLAGSPRIMLAGPGRGWLDARGWDRRGGEEALGRALLEAAREEGLAAASVGVADVPVAADAAARVAAAGGADDGAAGEVSPGRAGSGEPAGASLRLRVVPPGEARTFLAPLRLTVLPVRDGLRETLRAVGLRRVGELARLDRREVRARFGPEGVRAHRWARGEDDRTLPFESPGLLPSASLELDAPVRSTEPLLFALRQLLHRLCGDLAGEGRCAARVTVGLALETGEEREAEVAPARPTRREDLLFDLCRAAVERGGADGALSAPVAGLFLRVDAWAPAAVRQGDLFAAGDRDPLEAAAVLSRLRARLGPDAVVRPAPGDGHRPEARDAWAPVDPEEGDPGARRGGTGVRGGGRGGRGGSGVPGVRGREEAREGPGAALPGVLRLLPEPEPVEVSCREGRPVALRDRRGRHRVEAAEGPERVSGSWWEAPYAREYWWACTDARELLWIFRERPSEGGTRWRLHGWWD